MFVFTSKAETLEQIEKIVKKAKVLPQIRMHALNWDKGSVKRQIEAKQWNDTPLIIRSSSHQEDLFAHSQAGKYLSIANVLGIINVYEAIEKVVQSYHTISPKDYFFIQPMLQKTQMTGVACSFDPETGAPYRVINYDDQTGKTDAVTSGSTNDLKTYYAHRSDPFLHPAPLSQIIDLIIELEHLFKHLYLDIEFSITKDGNLHLLQVRPLIIRGKDSNLGCHTQFLHDIATEIKEASKPHCNVLGSQGLFGIMPDWNPAEIIGIRPRPLALSLYQELITDGAWAERRADYGYRNLKNIPILVNFRGLPYIDIRVSFNSLIPSDLEHSLAEKLVNSYLKKLSDRPHLHDKIEFEITFTCYTFDLKKRLDALNKNDFSQDEINQIEKSLKSLTNQIIHSKKALFFKDIEKITQLDQKRKQILNSPLSNLLKIHHLIKDCKEYGTIPFAGIARAAFIAFHILQSLVEIEILTPSEKAQFLASLTSVCSQMQIDKRKLSQDEFLECYGHLRQGTYDILSPNYASIPEVYFDWSMDTKSSDEKKNFLLPLQKQKEIYKLLTQDEIDHTCESLFKFLKTAIEAREYAKFLFTRNVNAILICIEELGLEMGLSKEDCSYLNIKEIIKGSDEKKDLKEKLDNLVLIEKNKHDLCKSVVLPPLIKEAKNVFAFGGHQAAPNFITQKKITASVSPSILNRQNIVNTIVMIPSADPGYEWIFSYPILGLITMYGGVNSHMSIRAYEMEIPAVIGAGETLYKQWSQAKLLEINCENKSVRVIH